MLYCLCAAGFCTCVCDCRVGGAGAGGGEGFSLCRPQVISKDQASLMSTGSSRGNQASHTALPTPRCPILCAAWLHTAPCWKIWCQPIALKKWPRNCFAKPCSLTVYYKNIYTVIFFMLSATTVSPSFFKLQSSSVFIFLLSVFFQRQNPTERFGADIPRNEWWLHQWELFCHLVPHRKPRRHQVQYGHLS